MRHMEANDYQPQGYAHNPPNTYAETTGGGYHRNHLFVHPSQSPYLHDESPHQQSHLHHHHQGYQQHPVQHQFTDVQFETADYSGEMNESDSLMGESRIVLA